MKILHCIACGTEISLEAWDRLLGWHIVSVGEGIRYLCVNCGNGEEKIIVDQDQMLAFVEYIKPMIVEGADV